MFNRLIIAVLTLGLILAFCSTAISSDGGGSSKTGLVPFDRSNPNATLEATMINTEVQNLSKPGGLEEHLLSTPTAVLPPTYFCDFRDYSNGDAYVYSLLPDDTYPIEHYMMRISTDSAYSCTLLGVAIGVYGAAHVNEPGVRVLLYDINDVPMDSVDLAWADISGIGFGYAYADFSTLNGGSPYVFEDSMEFNIGCAVITDGDDTLAFLAGDANTGVDDLGNNRSSFLMGGTYYQWSSQRAYLFGADLCCGRIPYTSCYSQEWDCGASSYYPMWIDYTNPMATKFSVGGPETLTAVGCALYIAAEAVGAADLQMQVIGVDGLGYPDDTQVYYSTVIPNVDVKYLFDTGEWNIVDLTALNLVMTGDFCVSWAAVNGNPDDGFPILGDGGVCPQGRSFTGYGGTWYQNGDLWSSGDGNYLMFADLCKDEFNTCKTFRNYCNEAYLYPMPDAYGDIAGYDLFKSYGVGCRVEKFRVKLADYGTGSGNEYTYDSEFQVWSASSVDGLMDTKLLGVTLTPADYVLEPGWTEIDFSTLPDEFYFDDNTWFGIESFAPTTDEAIWTIIDDGSCGGRLSAESWGSGQGYIDDSWSIDFNFVMELDVCCIPPDETICFAGEDWPVMGKDFARTFASFSGLGDIQGSLTKVWQYDASNVMVYASPVIYKDTVLAYFLDNLVALDINTGTQLWNRTPDGFEIGSGVYCTPTVFNFDAYGQTVTLAFTAGGDTKAFTAVNIADGSTWWTRGFSAHSNHFTTFSPSVIIDCGGTPVCVYSDDDGDVYAVNALTGALFGGWTVNPVSFGAAINQGITSDGTNVYVGTSSNAGNGNVFALDGCTGAILWDLETSGGQQLANLDPDNAGTEDFTGAMAYEDGALYAASIYSVNVVPPYNSGGVMYSINVADGSLNWAKLSIEHDFGGMSIDANQIIHSSWAPWVPGVGELRGPTGFNKNSGAYTFKNTTTNPGLGDFWLMGGVLDCEPEVADIFITQSRNDFLGFYRNTDGAMMFHRRWSGGLRAGHRTLPVLDDGHLLVPYRQHLVCLVIDAARPRLDIPAYTLSVPVEFGSPDHTVVTFPNALGNMGGAPLTINSITLLDADNGTIPPQSASMNTIDFDLLDNMQRVADKFASRSDMFRASFKDADAQLTEDVRVSRNNAAFAVPSWVYGVVGTFPMVIPEQGDYNDSSSYVDLDIEINGTMVPRGLTQFYAEIDSDDPDYFLDDGAPLPQIDLRIVGGCLFPEDPGSAEYELVFGVGGANFWYVWNTPFLGKGDLGHSAIIDGDDGTMWQGSYIFTASHVGDVPPGKPAGIFSNRVFHWADNWSSADPGVWMSILPDPNCYDATCAPSHRTNVYLGDISNDMGATYEPIYGNVAAYAFVDSAQDMCTYDTLGECLSWDWSDVFGGGIVSYNETMTVGFRGCVETFGAVDQPLLHNFMVQRFDLSGRYGVVDGLQFGAFMDYDLAYPAYNDIQVNGYDADISTAWVYNCNQASVNEGYAWGMVKIPFGCGYDGMVNSHTVSADGGGWNDTVVWLDSINYWMTSLSGLSHQQAPNPINPATCSADPSDREAMFTLANGLTLPEDGTGVTTIGVANFGYAAITEDVADGATFAAMANTANQWCGFGRGDVNGDGNVDLVDIAYMIDYVYYSGNGPYPFEHLGDVNIDDAIDGADVTYLIDYYFNFGPCIQGEWLLGGFTL